MFPSQELNPGPRKHEASAVSTVQMNGSANAFPWWTDTNVHKNVKTNCQPIEDIWSYIKVLQVTENFLFGVSHDQTTGVNL